MEEEVKFPDYILNKIDKVFLTLFKTELDTVFFEELRLLKKEPTYWNFYQWFDNTNGFNKALKSSCGELDSSELYEYRDSKDFWEKDILGASLTEMLYQHNVINEGVIDDILPCPFISSKNPLIHFIGVNKPYPN